MIGAVCDGCRKTVDPMDSVGWLMLQRVRVQGDYFARMTEWLSSTPEPAPDPLAVSRHFCTAECLVAYVTGGFRTVLQPLREVTP